MFNKLYKKLKENEQHIHITKKDIKHLAYIYDTQSKEIIDNINNHSDSYIYISQEDLRLLLNKLYDNTQELYISIANNLDELTR